MKSLKSLKYPVHWIIARSINNFHVFVKKYFSEISQYLLSRSQRENCLTGTILSAQFFCSFLPHTALFSIHQHPTGFSENWRDKLKICTWKPNYSSKHYVCVHIRLTKLTFVCNQTDTQWHARFGVQLG